MSTLPQYLLDGLRFVYDIQRPLLATGRHQFLPQQMIAITGANGCGKSTLLQILALLLPPAAGILRYRGQEVDDDNRQQYQAEVGLVAQNPYLLRGSVEYNISLGLQLRRVKKKLRKESCQQMMQKLHLDMALTTRSVRELSGGEAQKVALGRVLILQPEVLLLDEPFTWLDTASVEELSLLLRHLCASEGKTVLFSCHDATLAMRIADCCYRLEEGDLHRMD